MPEPPFPSVAEEWTDPPVRRAPADMYCDPAWPARACDNCGREYAGPAVYCSLVCALADAGGRCGSGLAET